MTGAMTPQETARVIFTIKSNSFEVSANIGTLCTTALANPQKWYETNRQYSLKQIPSSVPLYLLYYIFLCYATEPSQ